MITARSTGNALQLLLVDRQNKFNPSDLDGSRISNRNLAKLLDKDFGTIGKWITNIDSYKTDIKTLINLKL